jgi:hypothetical protein
MLKVASLNQSSNFELKNEPVELIRAPGSETASVPLGELEALRTKRPTLPASKYGLEVICGASCDVGAQ